VLFYGAKKMIKFVASLFALTFAVTCVHGSQTVDWSSVTTDTTTPDTFTVQQGNVLVTLSGLTGASFAPTGPEVINNTDLANQVSSSTSPILSSVNGVISTYGIFSNSNKPVTYTIQFLDPGQVSGVTLNLMNITGIDDVQYHHSYSDIVDFGNQVPQVSYLGADDTFANGKLTGNQPLQYDYGVGAFSSVFYSGPIPNNTISFTVETSTPNYDQNFVDIGLGGISYDPVPETTPLAIALGAVAVGSLLMVRRNRRTA
jgi:hypothetical protein